MGYTSLRSGFFFFYMAKEKVIKQPDAEAQALQKAIVHNSIDIVYLRNRKVKMKWLYGGVRDLLSKVLLEEKDESKVGAKCAALIVLNGLWSIKFFYWFLWRWFYYVKQYTEEEYLPLMSMCKKKVGAENYYLLTTLLIGMKDTMMAMTRKETERFLQEQKSGQFGL